MDQKKMDRDRGQLLDPVIERVAGKLPPDDHFLLRVPIELTIGLKTKDIPRIQDALVAWIVATAPTLKTVSLGRLNMPLTEVTPHGVPFKVSLHRSESGGIRMGVHYVAVIDENRVATLAARVAKACDDKLGKLFDWKRDDGARTVLVLEQDNLAMGNPANLSKALVAELATRGSATPDEVYYVGTYEGAGDWSVICLLRDGARWPDPDFQQFDPAQLHSITSR
ncbi:MAG: hypothetical protein SGI91_08415 [Alphaproteobacteria bacterium]|nr:hypothetical protein [Alphaproteobacteria bacterium]